MVEDPRAAQRPVADPVFALVEEVENLRLLNTKQSEMIRNLLNEQKQIREDMEALNELRATENAETRRMLSDLRSLLNTPNRTDRTDAYMATLNSLLLARGNTWMTFKEVGQCLELGQNREQKMNRLGKILLSFPDQYDIEEIPKGRGQRGRPKRVRLTDDHRRDLREHSKKKQVRWDG